MSTDDAQGWTDCHLHPIPADWRPAPDALPELLARLGITAIGHAVVHAVSDRWDAGDEPPAPVLEREAPSLEAVAELAAREDCMLLSLLCDPVAAGWGEVVASLRGPGSTWQPCLLSVGWGETTIPDARFERTAARFAFSLAFGGPGLPAKPERAAKAIPALATVAAAVERLSAVLGVPCAAHLACSDG